MKIVPLPVKPGAHMESQSGLQRGNPQIFCRYEEAEDRARKLAFVVVHPTSNFHDHYLIEPLAARRAGVLAVNTRYVGNDSMLIMERAVQDLGAGFRFLRAQEYERIVLIGNSGGGSLAALYQQQAEKLTISTTPDGRSFAYAADDLPAADAVALVAAHLGRAAQLLAKIDPSVIHDEEPDQIDPNLDMFAPANGPPHDENWLKAYRLAQAARLDRITTRVLSRLAQLECRLSPDMADEAFIIHRTQADPRNLDIRLDANDRKQGTLGGEAVAYNRAANGLARYCTLRSYLSQWSPRHTRAHGPQCLADCRVPVLVADFAAD
jgi:acetyl esterase/lipase